MLQNEMMSSTVWPILLDYSNDECRKSLRRLELEAYASVISAFRAQGEMSKEKKKMLQELSVALSISLERHKAEIRRAVNDEHLNTIADRLAGPNTSTEWSIEGRRLLPLMPRLIQQTAFTALANFAADAQAAKNSMMPFPCATGIKESNLNNEEPEFKLKRPPSADIDGRPGKIFAFDPYSSLPISCSEVSMDETASTLSPSAMPHSMLHTITSKDEVCNINKNSVKIQQNFMPCPLQKPPVPIISVNSKPLNGGTLLSTVNILPKSANVSAVKTVSVPITSSRGKHLSSNSVYSHLAGNSFLSSSSSGGTKLVDSVMTPLSSISGNHEATTSSTTSSNLAPSLKEKVFHASKLPVKPRLTASASDGSFLSTTFQPVQVSNQSTLKTSPSKLKSPCPRIASPVVSSSTTTVSQFQPATNVHSLNRVQSPVSTVARIPPAVGNAHRAASPMTLKQCPNTMSISASLKSVSKAQCVKPLCSSKPIITSTGKSITSKSHTLPTSTAARVSVQSCIKESSQTATKANLSLTCSQKSSSTQNNPGKFTNTITKAVHCRSESGLKIISQNLNANWVMPKSTAHVTSMATMSSSRLPTVSAGGSARIINFTQPVNARFARATITSPSVSLPGTFPTSGLRVAVSVGVNNTPVLRAAVPAKPNVIVVHKAQVWPQTPGATIVMTSSASLSRISNETLEEAVTLMQKQDVPRHLNTSSAVKGLNMYQTASLPSSATASGLPQSSHKRPSTHQAEVSRTTIKAVDESNTEKSTLKKQDQTAAVSFLVADDTLKDIHTDPKSREDSVHNKSERFAESCMEVDGDTTKVPEGEESGPRFLSVKNKNRESKNSTEYCELSQPSMSHENVSESVDVPLQKNGSEADKLLYPRNTEDFAKNARSSQLTVDNLELHRCVSQDSEDLCEEIGQASDKQTQEKKGGACETDMDNDLITLV